MYDSVDWDCWNRTEDWYNRQCPGKPLVDLTDIPECARSCFNEKNVCVEMTSNCLCSQPRPNCNSTTTRCGSTELGLYEAWYTKSCEYNLTANTTSVISPSTTEPSTYTPPDSTSTGGGVHKRLSNGAIAGVAISAATGVLALCAFMRYCCGSGTPKPNSAAATPPGLHEIGDPSNQRVRPDLIPNTVQSAPLVEVPGDSRRPASELVGSPTVATGTI